MKELLLEVGGEEYIIPDAENVDSWLKTLDPLIKDIVECNGFDAFEPITDIGTDTERAIAAAVENAMLTYRADQNLSWEDALNEAIEAALFEESLLDRQEQWIHGLSDFHSLMSGIEDCLEENGDVYINLEDIRNTISDKLVIELESQTITKPIDSIKNHSVRFVYVPDYGIAGMTLDSFDFYTDLPHVSEREGLFALCNLFRVRPISLINHLGIAQDETETIDKWIEHEAAFRPNDFQSEHANKVAYIIENSGVEYGTPMWIGMIEMSDILRIDPRKEIHLKGGQAGIHNFYTGAGYIDSLPDGNGIIIGPDQLLTAEVGYGEKSVYGITSQFLNASVSNTAPAKIKSNKRKYEDAMQGFDC